MDKQKSLLPPEMCGERTLAELGERINEEHRLCEAAMNQGLDHALACGRLLAEAKQQCDHGQWLPWLKENFEGSTRTARAYMRVVKHWPTLEAKRQTSANLSIDGALKLLAEPKTDSAPSQEPQGADVGLPAGFTPTPGQVLIAGCPASYHLRVAESIDHPGYWNAHIMDWRQQHIQDGGSVFGFSRPVRADYLALGVTYLLKREGIAAEDFTCNVSTDAKLVQMIRESGDEEARMLRWGDEFSWRHRG